MFDPLRITAYLQCGVESDWTLPIDAILYYQAMRKKFGAQDVTVSGGYATKKSLKAAMPLRIVNQGLDTWFYSASFAQWELGRVEGSDHWNKRFDQTLVDLVDFSGRRGRVVVEQGQYRAYHMPIFYRHAVSVSWYVVGDGDAVSELLRFVDCIGKKSSQGWGAVLRWNVETCPGDWSVRGDGGKLMRALPADDSRQYTSRLIYTGFRPSYWHRKNQTMCEMPNE